MNALIVEVICPCCDLGNIDCHCCWAGEAATKKSHRLKNHILANIPWEWERAVVDLYGLWLAELHAHQLCDQVQ